jgi:hypothetical protein
MPGVARQMSISMDNLRILFHALVPLGWPFIVGALILAYRRQLTLLIDAAITRIQRGDEIKVGLITIGQSVGQLKQPSSAEHLTDDHVALIHRSWRVPARDKEFGRPMYQIHIIVFGTVEALRRIDYVVYRLESAYPNPVQLGGPMETNFELKELANGYSLIRADVYVRGQQEPVRLARLIDLTEQSPPLKGSYQTMATK